VFDSQSVSKSSKNQQNATCGPILHRYKFCHFPMVKQQTLKTFITSTIREFITSTTFTIHHSNLSKWLKQTHKESEASMTDLKTTNSSFLGRNTRKQARKRHRCVGGRRRDQHAENILSRSRSRPGGYSDFWAAYLHARVDVLMKMYFDYQLAKELLVGNLVDLTE
jgi:hypothetical protein